MITPELAVHGAGFVLPFSKPGLPRTCVVVLPVPPAAVIESATVAVCVIPPPVAFTVTLNVPVVAVLEAVNVRVELPLPGAAMEVGLREAVTPDGSPVAESEIEELNPPAIAVEMVDVAELP